MQATTAKQKTSTKALGKAIMELVKMDEGNVLIYYQKPVSKKERIAAAKELIAMMPPAITGNQKTSTQLLSEYRRGD